MIAENIVQLVCIVFSAFCMGIGMGMNSWGIFLINLLPFLLNLAILIARIST